MCGWCMPVTVSCMGIIPAKEACMCTQLSIYDCAQHSLLPMQGVQFHPESIITDNGHNIVSNFVDSLPQQAAASAAELVHA